MTKLSKILMALPLLLLLGACNDHDLGKACNFIEAKLDNDASSDPSKTLVNEVVEQNVGHDCASFICIATKGSSGYCSQKCRNDAGCPDGFTCRSVQEIGPFANYKFCTFKECTTALDCGGEEDEFICKAISGIVPNEEIHLCQYKKEK